MQPASAPAPSRWGQSLYPPPRLVPGIQRDQRQILRGSLLTAASRHRYKGLRDPCPSPALGQERGPMFSSALPPAKPRAQCVSSEGINKWMDTRTHAKGNGNDQLLSYCRSKCASGLLAKLLSVAGSPLPFRTHPISVLRSGSTEDSCARGGLAWGQMSGPGRFHGEAGDSRLLKPPRAGL